MARRRGWQACRAVRRGRRRGRGRRMLPWRCEVTVGGATRTLLEDRDDEGEGAATLGNSR